MQFEIEEIKYLITLFTTVAAGLWAFWKYWQERKDREQQRQEDRLIQEYQRNVENLYSEDESQILGAVAGLDVYLENEERKWNVINILINRLYTENDSDVVSAIGSKLIDLINKLEMVTWTSTLRSKITDKDDRSMEKVKEVLEKLIDLNREFNRRMAKIGEDIDETEEEDFHDFRKSKRIGEAKKLFESVLQDFVQLDEKINNPDSSPSRTVRPLEQRWHEYQQIIEQEYRLEWRIEITSDIISKMLRSKRLQSLADISFWDNKLLETILHEVAFDTINIYDSSIEKCKLRETNFESARLYSTEFSQTSFERISRFRNCYIRKSIFFDKTGFYGTQFHNTRFRRCTFSHVKFQEARFEDCKFEKVIFQDCRFISAVFQDCKMEQVLFFNCTL